MVCPGETPTEAIPPAGNKQRASKRAKELCLRAVISIHPPVSWELLLTGRNRARSPHFCFLRTNGQRYRATIRVRQMLSHVYAGLP